MQTAIITAILDRLREIKARDLMTSFTVTVNEEESLIDVANRMMRFRISGLPVVSSMGKIVGIITVTDLFKLMDAITPQGPGAQSPLGPASMIKEVMTREVYSIEKETSLLDIITLMRTKNIHTLPVVEKDTIIGIVGRRDVIQAYYSQLRLE
jgi:CBS domain-containing protein